MLRIAQVGDVAHVAQALTAALSDQVVFEFELRQRGASRRGVTKALAAPIRLLDAVRVARQVRRDHPDVGHVHWLPNGIVGPMLGCPWILHVHGDDLRTMPAPRQLIYPRILSLADAVVVSTPDLLPLAPDSTWLPVPIPRLHISAPTRYDVLINARAHVQKGSATSFEALRLIHAADASLRLAAMDGPSFEEGPWDRIGFVPKAQFHRLLASSKIVIGQFQAGALGIADLEAMALGRPVVTWVRDVYPDPPPVTNAHTAREVASAVLAGPSAADAANWVERTHGREVVLGTLLPIYDRVVARRRMQHE